MKQWGNSRELTRKSYDLVKENPGVTRWTVRAAIHGALFGALGVLPGLVLFVLGGDLLEGDSDTLGIVLLALAVVLLVGGGLAGLTAANLQMAGLVHVADDVLHGREPDEEAARAAAHSHLRTLAAWSAISMAVSAVIRSVSIARRWSRMFSFCSTSSVSRSTSPSTIAACSFEAIPTSAR